MLAARWGSSTLFLGSLPKPLLLPKPPMGRKLFFGSGLLFALATTGPVFAQQAATSSYPACTKAISTNESELAHQKYIAGKQDYDEGNYESAVRRFRDAYNLDCQKHELLIIISAAYERKGDKKEAIAALETYVERAPNAPDAGTYKTKIDNLKKQVAATPPPSATPSPPPEMQEHTIPPWIVVGVGGAAIVTGVLFFVLAPALPANCHEDTSKCDPVPNPTPEDNQRLLAQQDDAGRAVSMPRIGLGFTIGGGVLVAGGLLWHFLEPTGPKERPAQGRALAPRASLVRPALAPGYAGLSFGGTF